MELVLSGRPKESKIPDLISSGITHVLCILQDSEVGSLLSAYRYHNLPYTHHPYSIKKCQKSSVDWLKVRSDLQYLSQADGNLFIHCAAGIHRTGTNAYAILRNSGLTRDRAYTEVIKLRPESADCIRFLDWADEYLLGE